MTATRTGEVDTIVSLSAQHITTDSVEAEDDGEPLFWIEDGETAVEICHEIGNDEAAARALVQLADALREHAERIRYRARLRTAGWT